MILGDKDYKIVEILKRDLEGLVDYVVLPGIVTVEQLREFKRMVQTSSEGAEIICKVELLPRFSCDFCTVL